MRDLRYKEKSQDTKRKRRMRGITKAVMLAALCSLIFTSVFMSAEVYGIADTNQPSITENNSQLNAPSGEYGEAYATPAAIEPLNARYTVTNYGDNEMKISYPPNQDWLAIKAFEKSVTSNGYGRQGYDSKAMYLYSDSNRGNFDTANSENQTYQFSDYNNDFNGTKFDNALYRHNWTWSNIPHVSGTGILVSYGRGTHKVTHYVGIYISVPDKVTSFTVSADLYTAICLIGYGNYNSDVVVDVTADMYVYEDRITEVQSDNGLGYETAWCSTCNANKPKGHNHKYIRANQTEVKDGGTKISDPGSSGKEYGMNKTTSSRTIVRQEGDTTDYTVVLKMYSEKNNYWWSGSNDGEDHGQMYAILGNLRVDAKGPYTVRYNANNGIYKNMVSGTMSDTVATYGTGFYLRNNAFVHDRGGTFLGWSTSANTTKVYNNQAGVSNLTTTINGTVNLYAVFDTSNIHDFGKRSGATGLWGSASNPFLIENASHWRTLVTIVNGGEAIDSITDSAGHTTNATDRTYNGCYFVVTNDLNLGAVDPVGKDSSYPFKGIIYGADNSGNKVLRTINATISVSSGHAGLFGNLNGGRIEYLKSTGSVTNNTSTSAGNGTGGIVGYVSGTATITNCESSMTVIANTGNTNDYQGEGGIVGVTVAGSTVNITNCTYSNSETKSVYGYKQTAGILGQAIGSSSTVVIKSCKVLSGEIKAYADSAAGIVGAIRWDTSVNLTIDHCYNGANVTTEGNKYASASGGAMGCGYIGSTFTVSNFVNTGNIVASGSSKDYVGGVIGQKAGGSSAILTNCYNFGTISGGSSMHIISGTTNSTISNCWGLYEQNTKSDSVGNNINSLVSSYDSIKDCNVAMLAIGKSPNPTLHYGLADNSNNVYKLSDIANPANVTTAFNRFVAYPSVNTSVENSDRVLSYNQYLSTVAIDGSGNRSVVTPTYSNNREVILGLGPSPDKNDRCQTHLLAINDVVINPANMPSGTSKLAIVAVEYVTAYDDYQKTKKFDYGTALGSAINFNNYISTGNSLVGTTQLLLEYGIGNANWQTLGTFASTATKFSGTVFTDVGVLNVGHYDVKVTFKNDSHVMGFVRYSENIWINPANLTVTATATADSPYTYNGGEQGLIGFTVAGLTNDSWTINSVLNPQLFKGSQNIWSSSASTETKVGTTGYLDFTKTKNAGDYSFKFNKNGNFNITVQFAAGNTLTLNETSDQYVISWSIAALSLTADNIYFGLSGTDGIASNCLRPTDSLHMLDRKPNGNKFEEGNAPYSLVFKNTDTCNINNYKIYISNDNGSTYDGTLLTADTDYEISGGNNLSGYNSETVVTLTIGVKSGGSGNVSGEKKVRFTLMLGDFGGNSDSTGYGSDNNPYLIESAAQLTRLSEITNGAKAWNSLNDSTYALFPNSNVSTNITCDTWFRYWNGKFKLAADISVDEANGFKPIGIPNSSGGTTQWLYFVSSFDGQGYTITIALMQDYSTNYRGLFGCTSSANISNLNLTGTVWGTNRVGGLVGYAQSTEISNVTSSISLWGNRSVGGIVGTHNGGSIEGCTNRGLIQGVSGVGGIVGDTTSSNLTISNCTNSGTINHRDVSISLYYYLEYENYKIQGIGGIIGAINEDPTATSFNVTISGCTVSANGSNFVVDGYDQTNDDANGVGGIVGFGYASNGLIRIGSLEIENANGTKTTIVTSNGGYVRGGSFVGGIIGYANGVYIHEDCVMQAHVTGTQDYAGGVAGKWVVKDTDHIPQNRKIDGNVVIEGNRYVGGLLGWLDATAATGVVLHPQLSNGVSNAIAVRGHSYVGALYGVIDGYGYKRSSINASDDDTKIFIDPVTSQATGNPYIYVNLTLRGGDVAGGLIGFVRGAGVIFLGDWVVSNHIPITFEGITNFFGGVIGVLGENAAVENGTNTSGTVTVGGNPVSISYGTQTSAGTISANDTNKRGNFVGSLFGYIASSAGSYFDTGNTTLGKDLMLYNYSTVYGASYVGGVFGGMGKLDSIPSGLTLTDDSNLSNLLLNGVFGGSGGNTNTLRYSPSDGHGKLFNFGTVSAANNYVGGIVGYVGEGVLLNLVNPVIESKTTGFSFATVTGYLTVYNGKINPNAESSLNYIVGTDFVGGIAGYLGSSAHVLTRVINICDITGTNNVGGLVGRMGNGSVNGCFSTSSYTNPYYNQNSTDNYRTSITIRDGGNYVGGLVGNLISGSITGSITRDFDFSKVGNTIGGIVGSLSVGTNVSSSWAIFLVENPTYSTTSINKNGKYLIIDRSLIGDNNAARLTKYEALGKAVGLFGNDVDISDSAFTGKNPFINGFVSVITPEPVHKSGSNGKDDKQLVFYDVSGEDRLTTNTFGNTNEVLAGESQMVYYRFNMATATSFSICLVKVEFKNIKSDPPNGSEAQYAKDGYVHPSNATSFYEVHISEARFENKNIKTVSGYVYVSGRADVVLGEFTKTYDIGSDSSTPYVIADKQQWINFANNVKNGTDYADKFVKLAADITVEYADIAGDRNGNTTKSFRGTFDGDGHTITFNYTSDNASELTGLSVFPEANGAKFKNLTITGSITATGNAYTSTSGAYNVAAFVGQPMGNLTFENCTSDVDIMANHTAGGIVGFTNGYKIDLITCVNTGDIDCNDRMLPSYTNYEYGTGGIIGYANNNITIESCKNEGNVTGGYNVGGIIGYNDGTSENVAETNIYNSANTGTILADSSYSSDNNYAAYRNIYGYDSDNAEKSTYKFTYAGGLIGKIGEYGKLDMRACYNSGSVAGFGIIQGGLVGSIGTFNLGSWNDTNSGSVAAQSFIAYCYNTGAVYSGGKDRINPGTSTTEHDGAHNKRGGREEMNGGVTGGIVGFVVWCDISYCYNTGKITLFRLVSEYRKWDWAQVHIRGGGIAGQAQPSGDNRKVKISYCYNLGEIYAYANMGMEGTTNEGYPVYGGGMVGYIDGATGNDSDDSKVDCLTHCYTISNYLHYYNFKEGVAERKELRGSKSLNEYSNYDNKHEYYWVKYYRPGVSTLSDGTPLTVEHFTTYLGSDGKFKVDRPIGYQTKTENSLNDDDYKTTSNYNQAGTLINLSAIQTGTAYGYIYIYGCLPQLAVFALDTKEGLSMLSYSYGRKDDISTNDFVQRRAGSKESPYVIKDGVGVLAMSALTGARAMVGGSGQYYNFEDKYVEFADGVNNIEGLSAKYINMRYAAEGGNALADALKSSSDTQSGQVGKNYFLWKDGAASGFTELTYGSDNIADRRSTLRSNWLNKSHMYNGSALVAMDNDHSWARDTIGGSFTPIGSQLAPFKGNISGLQGADGNTEIFNLHIYYKASTVNSSYTDTYAGLFGAVIDANISNITVSGRVNGYSAGDSSEHRAFAGAIAGYAGGNTTIKNCNAGSTSRYLELNTYADVGVKASPNSLTYSGGIVGAIGPSGLRGRGASHVTARIENCKVVNAASGDGKIRSLTSNAGGIAGFVGNPWYSGDNNTDSENWIYITGSEVNNAKISSVDTATSNNVGFDIGGIVGSNDGKTLLVIDGLKKGEEFILTKVGVNSAVTISGERSVGGIIGTARGNVSITNVNVAANTTVERVARGTVTNEDGLYRTSIGGIVGRALTDTTNVLGQRNETKAGEITFAGTVNVNEANSNSDNNNPTANIGGIIGSMSRGTVFSSGCTVTVSGNINSDLTDNVRNIGGVAGATIAGAFDGTFNIYPTISAQNATNVGGFIGRNFGEVNILSSGQTTVTIGSDTKAITIKGKSQVGGLVGLIGYKYSDGTIAGKLVIGADTYQGTPYHGELAITVHSKATIEATDGDVGGLIGKNEAAGENNGLVITKGQISNYGSVVGNDNVGGLIGNNVGNISMGGSSVEGATFTPDFFVMFCN